MELGMIGLGKMGGNMTRRLLHGGHRVVVYDRSAEAVDAAADEGAVATESLEDLASRLGAPRAVWMMVTSGMPTEETIEQLGGVLEEDDTIIDGGNSNYNDTVRRAAMLEERGLHYVDVGTSAGI